ncbi:MATE family efflux transporter [Enterococcus rivorum]|uniref:Multidrug export protein MepA n=1 Tax=Enterococcus rivorum TaxID=762845 RepID=A0A1E5L046_9ENTE|nr:MATE family efflux transporter [Enterococcus rivorum]MBP2100223.1 putative MATE family efflux protein [Enterococcus rivorum]OEH83444.1 MATE family efflux transporter [Enterococcus rivorum]
MEAVNPLGTEKISKLLIKFSVPAIIGMLVNALYNVVDRIFIGNAPGLGANGLAGITIGFPIMIIMMSVGMLFGIGGATLFSMKLGEGKRKEAEEILGNTFILLLISGSVLLVLGTLFLGPMLQFFGASEAVLPFVKEYMGIIFFGSIFQVMGMGLNNFLRADGQPKLAMITMFVGAGTNIILDPILIYVFDMGMAGAALATIFSQFISMAWILNYFLRGSGHRIQRKNLKIKRWIVTRVVSLGLPSFLLQLGNSLLNVVLNKSLLTYGGDLAVSGMGIVNSIQTILLMPIIGLNQGLQPIISFNFGAKKFARVKEAVKLGIMVATLIVFLGWGFTRLFPEIFVRMFNQEPDLVAFGSYALKAWFWGLPVIGFQIIAANFFQATGRSKIAIFLTMTRQIILLIPAILIFSNIWGLNGIVHAAPFADIVAAILTFLWFSFEMRRLSRVENELNLEVSLNQTPEIE